MKRTSYAVRPGWVAMGLAVALLAAARWLPSPPVEYGPAGVEHAGHESAANAERPTRRVRASSTMPYFSFARALRSGG